jgi:L-alanine-DL-glutamate epimerase-like enolase superfamily enzyme
MTDLPRMKICIDKVDVFVCRAPIDTPVRTSFGVMYDRPAVFVRVTDTEGAVGWGETWCNFPSCGAEHRARLIETVMVPLLLGRSFDGPGDAFAHLSKTTAVLALQSGEAGPIAQAISGLDLALWDLCAQRAQKPLWQYLGGASSVVKVYASGINPDRPQDIISQCQSEGYNAFKLKIGFGKERDISNLETVRRQLGNDVALMVDANQAWTLDEASAMAPYLSEFGLTWLEEPLRTNRPEHEWQALAATCATPLAAGENIMGEDDFNEVSRQSSIAVVQPDVAKWGGISGCWPVIQAIQASGKLYCPHYLGAGVGLLASAHLLAATGGQGMLEIDANRNPLRSGLAGVFSLLKSGTADLKDAPGVGVSILLEQDFLPYLVSHSSVH